jgi:hypothetical protein
MLGLRFVFVAEKGMLGRRKADSVAGAETALCGEVIRGDDTPSLDAYVEDGPRFAAELL